MIVVGLTCAVWGSGGLLAEALPPTMSAGELKTGMTGTGYTVFDSSGEVQPFQVDVIGITDTGKGADRRIMAKASGANVEASRGVLQGMSGSPIYIDGYLVGALSYGNAIDAYTFFITPIGDMLTLWNHPDNKNKTQISNIDLKQVAEDRAKAAEQDKEKEAKAENSDPKGEEKLAADTAKEKSAKTEKVAASKDNETTVADENKDAAEPSKKETADTAPNTAENPEKPSIDLTKDIIPGEEKSLWYFGGFGETDLTFLRENVTALNWEGITPLALPATRGGAATDYQAALEPGSPVGVALVCGDFFVGATGTVTAVEGNRILAFGHPFTHRGNVNYFMLDAAAVGTIGGYGAGMRIANPGKIIGRVNQDREYGISGIIGRYPSVVPMRVSVTGLNQEEAAPQVYHTSIAYDETVLPQLSAGIAYASMNRASDREGEGTAKVHFVIRTDAVEDGKVERSNMYYNLADVGQVAVLELAKALNVICTNTEREADILDVQVEVAVDGIRKTASLVTAVPEKAKVKPGETVNIKATIQPFRQEKETVVIPYTVPKTQRVGTMQLDVRGGGFVPVNALQLLQQQGITVAGDDSANRTMQERLKELTVAGMNNEIIVAPGAAPALTEKEQKKLISESLRASAEAAKKKSQARKVNLLGQNPAEGENKPGEAKIATDYVIDNVIHTTLQVVR
ncbi:MAG: SpoIVB peptidase S55 domain protein [Selenomonadaceae bacterium]|nr:SpoIVB peptidase S55 domain protein [Selenomonadaceae bacterium]